MRSNCMRTVNFSPPERSMYKSSKMCSRGEPEPLCSTTLGKGGFSKHASGISPSVALVSPVSSSSRFLAFLAFLEEPCFLPLLESTTQRVRALPSAQLSKRSYRMYVVSIRVSLAENQRRLARSASTLESCFASSSALARSPWKTSSIPASSLSRTARPSRISLMRRSITCRRSPQVFGQGLTAPPPWVPCHKANTSSSPSQQSQMPSPTREEGMKWASKPSLWHQKSTVFAETPAQAPVEISSNPSWIQSQ
mmetsp:Transcript_24692/g.72412  ORF Transcript_24692/g.72412 Transcript_24692/m.72412 type:complete len:252 (-) Transcript_24692:373-1128(-)